MGNSNGKRIEGFSMKKTISFRFIVLLVLAAPTLTWAELGGNAASVQTDQVQMKAGAIHSATTGAKFSMQQYQTSNGCTIKEFMTPSGTVFAVRWEGPLMPNLRQLLGQYFSDYVNAAKNHHGSHSHFSIQQSDLVMQSMGYMRAFSGIAYIPSLMPAGVTAAQLQ